MDDTHEPHVSVALRLEGSEALIAALDSHMLTCEVAKTLAQENGTLSTSVAELRLRYAHLLNDLLESMRCDLLHAGWTEVRPSVWQNPQQQRFRGSEAAWRAMKQHLRLQESRMRTRGLDA